MITSSFLSKDPTATLTLEGEYQALNGGSVETEVGEFLYGMVKICKPTNILETGTYHGWSSAYMAQALKENGFGHLDTLEYEKEFIELSKDRWSKLGLIPHITVMQQDVRDFTPTHEYDLMFLDTEPGLRFAELVKFYPYLKPGGFVFLHDLPRGFCQGNVNPDHPEFLSWPWGTIPVALNTLLKEKNLVPWHFPNPREMTGFYKPKEDDYVA